MTSQIRLYIIHYRSRALWVVWGSSLTARRLVIVAKHCCSFTPQSVRQIGRCQINDTEMNKTCAINLLCVFDMQPIQIQNPGGVKLDIPVPVQWGPEGHAAALSDCITPAEWSGVECRREVRKENKEARDRLHLVKELLFVCRWLELRGPSETRWAKWACLQGDDLYETTQCS